MKASVSIGSKFMHRFLVTLLVTVVGSGVIPAQSEDFAVATFYVR